MAPADVQSSVPVMPPMMSTDQEQDPFASFGAPAASDGMSAMGSAPAPSYDDPWGGMMMMGAPPAGAPPDPMAPSPAMAPPDAPPAPSADDPWGMLGGMGAAPPPHSAPSQQFPSTDSVNSSSVESVPVPSARSTGLKANNAPSDQFGMASMGATPAPMGMPPPPMDMPPAPPSDTASIMGMPPAPPSEPASIMGMPAPLSEPAPIMGMPPAPPSEPAPIMGLPPAPPSEPAPIMGLPPAPPSEPAPMSMPAAPTAPPSEPVPSTVNVPPNDAVSPPSPIGSVQISVQAPPSPSASTRGPVPVQLPPAMQGPGVMQQPSSPSRQGPAPTQTPSVMQAPSPSAELIQAPPTMYNPPAPLGNVPAPPVPTQAPAQTLPASSAPMQSPPAPQWDNGTMQPPAQYMPPPASADPFGFGSATLVPSSNSMAGSTAEQGSVGTLNKQMNNLSMQQNAPGPFDMSTSTPSIGAPQSAVHGYSAPPMLSTTAPTDIPSAAPPAAPPMAPTDDPPLDKPPSPPTTNFHSQEASRSDSFPMMPAAPLSPVSLAPHNSDPFGYALSPMTSPVEAHRMQSAESVVGRTGPMALPEVPLLSDDKKSGTGQNNAMVAAAAPSADPWGIFGSMAPPAPAAPVPKESPVAEGALTPYSPPSVAPQSEPGAPQNALQNQYGAPSNAPQNQYGVPNNAPQNQYSAPNNAPQNQYGVPNNPPQNQYGVPNNAPPNQYGAPNNAPPNQYGAPNNAPPNQYGAPNNAPQNQYGAPNNAPQNQYGAPNNAPQNQYSAVQQGAPVTANAVVPSAAQNVDPFGIFGSPAPSAQNDPFGGSSFVDSSNAPPPVDDDPFGIFGSPTPVSAPPTQAPAPPPPPQVAAPSEVDPWAAAGFGPSSTAPAPPASYQSSQRTVTTSASTGSNYTANTDNNDSQRDDVPIELDQNGLPTSGEYYEARVNARSLGAMFYTARDLEETLLYRMSSNVLESMGGRPIVAYVAENSAAEHHGVHLGHCVLSVNGRPVTGPDECAAMIKNSPRPMNLRCYVMPDLELTPAEGSHMVKYDTRDMGAAKSNSDWKGKYVVIGGILAKPWMMMMYRSKREYDTAVKETHSNYKVSVKVKQFDLRGARIISKNPGRPDWVHYPSEAKPWHFFVVLPNKGYPIKISADSPDKLKPVHSAIQRFLKKDMEARYRYEEQYGPQGGYRSAVYAATEKFTQFR